MVLFLIFLIFVFSFILIKAADHVVIAIRALSRETHTKVFAISAVLLAFTTSLPELFVGITSSLEGNPNLSFGNIIGANIANISLVAGLSAFLVGKVHIHGANISHEFGIGMIAGIIPLILIFDGELTRIDGIILVLIYCAYAISFFKNRFLQVSEFHGKESFAHRLFRSVNHMQTSRSKEIVRLFMSFAILFLSAQVIVKIATGVAELAHLPTFIIGVVILSVSTTLPELALSFRSLKDHEPKMFLGNLLGSIIVNSTLIIGFVSIISPIKLVAHQEYLVAASFFVLIFVGFWFLIRSKFTLERWEAAALLILYLIFIVVELL